MRFLTLLLIGLLLPTFAFAGLKAESSLDDVLQSLYDVGKDLKSFSANVTLRETDNISHDSWRRTGPAVYERSADGNARFRVTFLKRIQDELSQDQRIEYLLQDNWLTERNYTKKVEVKRQVAHPGDKINLIKLGEGPFPLPIGQQPSEVLRLFDVQKLVPAKDDQPNTIHLVLTPKPKTAFARKFSKLDVWVDLDSSMPRRIDTVDANESMVHGTDLSDLRLNVPLTNEHFALPERPADWQHSEEEYKD